MDIVLVGLAAVIFYLLSSFLQYQHLAHAQANNAITKLLASFAVILHGITTYQLMQTNQGVDVGLLPMVTLIGCVSAALTLLISFKKSVDNWYLLLFPTAVLSLLAALFIPPSVQWREQLSGGLIAHILLSVFAYSLLMISACQALLLACQDYHLRHKQNSFMLNTLPPVQTMETLLFALLNASFVLLTLSIFTGILFLKNLFAQHVAHKTIFSIVSWGLLAALLWGRHARGWRGHTAIRLTLSAFVLLLLAYVGSSVVLQFILHRTI